MKIPGGSVQPEEMWALAAARRPSGETLGDLIGEVAKAPCNLHIEEGLVAEWVCATWHQQNSLPVGLLNLSNIAHDSGRKC